MKDSHLARAFSIPRLFVPAKARQVYSWDLPCSIVKDLGKPTKYARFLLVNQKTGINVSYLLSLYRGRAVPAKTYWDTSPAPATIAAS
jgi:hypothetical protein